MSDVRDVFEGVSAGDGKSVVMTRVLVPVKNGMEERFLLGAIADKFGALYEEGFEARGNLNGTPALSYLVPPQNEKFFRKDVGDLLSIINRKHSSTIRPPKGMDLEDMD